MATIRATSLSTFLQQQLTRLRLRCRLIFTRPTQFIVVTNGRSGSNLLLELLTSHPRVKHCGEYFTDKRMKSEDLTDRDLLAEFKARLRRSGFEKATGAKFLYYQLEPEYAERFNLPELRRVQRYVLDNRQLRIVHLIRRNTVKTVVSMLVAAKTGVYRAHNTDELAHGASIEIDPGGLLRRLETVRDYEERARLWFRHHRVLDISYEDLIADRALQANRLLDFLQVDRMPLTSRLVRQGKTLRDSVANFGELELALAGTPWEPMLTEP